MVFGSVGRHGSLSPLDILQYNMATPYQQQKQTSQYVETAIEKKNYMSHNHDWFYYNKAYDFGSFYEKPNIDEQENTKRRKPKTKWK